MTTIIKIAFIFLLSAVAVFAGNTFVAVNISSGISPSTASIISKSIDYSVNNNAQAIIINLNTPGGLLESTRDIVGKIMASKIPVIVYVSPSGARAGSAGVFITLSANIAAMAPSTNIGAAHPVGLRGESDSSVMFDKITNDASAFIRSIAQRRGKNIIWAENAVRQSISATETEALQDSVIDFISRDIYELIRSVDGKTVETVSGIRKISSKNFSLLYYEPSFADEILKIISEPNIAYALLMLGILGLMIELYHPGAIFPGVIGGISIILAAYALQMLPVNFAALGLIFLAIVLFILEIKIVSHGLLTIGGVISIFFGSIMLFDTPEESLKVSLSLIITIITLIVLFFTFVATLGIKAQYRKRTSGIDGLISEEGIAFTDLSPGSKGKVKIHGELWNAETGSFIAKETQIIVIAVKSLTLIVKPK